MVVHLSLPMQFRMQHSRSTRDPPPMRYSNMVHREWCNGKHYFRSACRIVCKTQHARARAALMQRSRAVACRVLWTACRRVRTPRYPFAVICNSGRPCLRVGPRLITSPERLRIGGLRYQRRLGCCHSQTIKLRTAGHRHAGHGRGRASAGSRTLQLGGVCSAEACSVSPISNMGASFGSRRRPSER